MTLTAHELMILNNALNELCNGVKDLDSDNEFATRLGASRDEVRVLLAEFGTIIERAQNLPP